MRGIQDCFCGEEPEWEESGAPHEVTGRYLDYSAHLFCSSCGCSAPIISTIDYDTKIKRKLTREEVRARSIVIWNEMQCAIRRFI